MIFIGAWFVGNVSVNIFLLKHKCVCVCTAGSIFSNHCNYSSILVV